MEKIRYMQNHDDEQKRCDIHYYSKLDDEEKQEYEKYYPNPLSVHWFDVNWVFQLSKKSLEDELKTMTNFDYISQVGFHQIKVTLLYKMALFIKTIKKYEYVFKGRNYLRQLEQILNKSVIDKTFTVINKDFTCTLPYCSRCSNCEYSKTLACNYLLNDSSDFYNEENEYRMSSDNQQQIPVGNIIAGGIK